MFNLCNVVLLLLDCFYFGYFVARMMQIWYLVMFPGLLPVKYGRGFLGQPLISFPNLCNLANVNVCPIVTKVIV